MERISASSFTTAGGGDKSCFDEISSIVKGTKRSGCYEILYLFEDAEPGEVCSYLFITKSKDIILRLAGMDGADQFSVITSMERLARNHGGEVGLEFDGQFYILTAIWNGVKVNLHLN